METSISSSSSSSSSSSRLQEIIEEKKDWSKAVVYNHEGKVIASTFDVDLNEIEELLPIFNDEENAFRSGIRLNGEQYDVHRFFETLIYGRKVDQKTGDGICIWRTKNDKGSSLFMLITYAFPTLSAKAVPELQEFCKAHVEPLL
jgi:hypothetical protein